MTEECIVSPFLCHKIFNSDFVCLYCDPGSGDTPPLQSVLLNGWEGSVEFS